MTKLYPYQKQGVRQIQKFKGRVLLADEMGLGKTIQALKWCEHFADGRPILVVCPAHLKWVWEAQAQDHTKLHTYVLSGRTPPSKKPLHIPPVLIINYDILDLWVPFLLKLQPQTLIIDECHYIKNRSRKIIRTRKVRTLSKHIPNVIAISGTPLTNRPAELWTTLNIVRPDLYPKFTTFADQYCKPKWTPWGWQYKGAHNLGELHRILKSRLMIRRRKKDVLPDLPEKTRTVIPLQLKNDKEYREAEKDLLLWLSKKSPAKVKRAAKALELVKLGYLKRLAAELKVPQVIEWVDSFLEETNDKLIIFGIHKNTLQPLWQKYKDQGVLIIGATPLIKRKKAVQRFQHDKKCRVLIGNIQAAGTGITLTAAHDVLFTELGWTPGEHTQAEDRIHRIGQTYPANIYYAVAKHTIEEPLAKLIQTKQNILDQTLDGAANVEHLNIFDQLKQSLMKGTKDGKRQKKKDDMSFH